ncbi:hypothetical protein AB0G15_06145 [Streptosporangium sp. NPDC023825]|uniref:hypothetical protein n=1 Tax=Streptosporangium sp. NPDC023825 TaxID=3154909 RepID=UPI0034312444
MPSGRIQCGAGQCHAFLRVADVGDLVGQGADEVGLQGAVSGFAGGADTQLVGLGGLVVPARVAGDPSDDLCQFADVDQQRPACLLGVRATPVEPYRRVKLTEDGPDQVASSDDVIGEPQTVNPCRQILHGAHPDPPALAGRSRWSGP